MSQAYFNERADIWDETVAEKDAARLEQMARRLNLQPGATVLDVGSGTGVFLPFLLRVVGRQGRIVALDFAERMLKKAHAKGFDHDIAYLQADVSHVPARSESFDAIVCYSSFPHFPDKPKALGELRRVIKNGGQLLICHTSSRTQINALHRQVPAVKNDTLPDEAEMQGMLAVAGFTGIRIEDKSDSYLVSAEKPAVSSS
ncbi:MAG: methyltransferase domain-containing protein [Dehalococcoidales bacterium]|nr:methyltransferase domain-containing protein [Dehalococcoidales bacterium]